MGSGEETEKDSGKKAEEDYLSGVRIRAEVNRIAGLGDGGWRAERDNKIALGQNILREELGYFGDWTGSGYKLDQTTRDRLLAHSRQDIAATFGIADSALRYAYEARQYASWAVLFLVVSIGLNIAILATLLWARLP